MATCPACALESPDDGGECPRCHLSFALFDAVREAAGPSGESDPTYLRTIGELLATVDRTPGADTPVERSTASADRVDPAAELAEARGTPPARRGAPPIDAVVELPPAPLPYGSLPEVEHRLREYFQVGRRLGLDFTDFEARAGSAALVTDLSLIHISEPTRP